MFSCCPRLERGIGKYGGGLKDVALCDLAATVVREAVSRSGVQIDDVGHVVFGSVIHTEARDVYNTVVIKPSVSTANIKNAINAASALTLPPDQHAVLV